MLQALYIGMLLVFSLMLLTEFPHELRDSSVGILEIVVWIWMGSLFAEEVVQVYVTGDSPAFCIDDYKCSNRLA